MDLSGLTSLSIFPTYPKPNKWISPPMKIDDINAKRPNSVSKKFPIVFSYTRETKKKVRKVDGINTSEVGSNRFYLFHGCH